MIKQIIISAVSAILYCASIAAHAERFSLDCTLTGNHGVLTFIVDTDKKSVDDMSAIIDDRKIVWNDDQWRNSIDRPTGVLTSSKIANNSAISKANCTRSVAYKPGSNPMGELANQSGKEFEATLEQCKQFPAYSSQLNLCINRISKKWLLERGKEYENIPDGYITGNDLARAFIEKTK